MSTSPLSRRRFLLASGSLGAATALSQTAATATPSFPLDGSSEASLESELAALDQPIYLFETRIPDTVTAESGGALSISDDHAKAGAHSLRWDYEPGNQLRIETPLSYQDIPAPGQVAYFAAWLYTEEPIDGVLQIEFGRGSQADASVDVHLDFRGWRACWIRYSADTVGTPHPDMDRITFTAPEVSSSLWIDLLITNTSLRDDRPAPDFQIPTAGEEVLDANNYHWMGLYDYWRKREDPGFGKGGVTDAEISDARTVHARLLNRQRADREFDEASLSALESTFTDFGIPELVDYTAAGDELRLASTGSFINDKQLEIVPEEFRGALEDVAGVQPLRALWEQCGLIAAQTWDSAYRAGDETAASRAAKLVLRLFTHMQDQGWALGSGQGTIHHIGYTYRAWAQSLLMIEPLLREHEIWEREVATLEWFTGSGRLTHNFSQNRHRSGLMDVLNTMLEGLLTTCFATDDWEERAHRLRAFATWTNHAFSYSPGISSGFKPDGAMYHHAGPYPLYGRDALGGATPVLLDCAGTEFAITPESQDILKQALRHQVLIANTLDYPLSQSGRQQTGTQDIRKLVNTHALLGRTRFDGADGYDIEHASMFRRLLPASDPSSWQLRMEQEFSDASIKEAAAPQGYWAFPYAGSALSRHGERLITVRGHNRYLWSTEIYDQNNIYGRYQTYGQITVQADTDSDGWVSTEENGEAHPGFDWNFIPGTTTKTLPFEKLAVTLDGTFESMPMSESRFGGPAVLSEHASAFGMELREHPSFDPSHTARLSALLVGNRVIALGSGVRNDDASHPTRTTLFQQCPDAMPGPDDIAGGEGWVTDHSGNGYIHLAGPAITHRTGEQTTPDQSGNETATRVVTLGYLDHGTAPTDAEYGYVLLPGAGAENTATFREQMRGQDPPVVIHQRDRAAHVATDTASGITAYTVFDPDSPLGTDSVVRSLDRQGIVLVRPTGDGRTTDFSVTDPDLHLYEGRDEEQYAPDGTYVGDKGPYSRPWRYSDSPRSEIAMVLTGMWRVRGSGHRKGIRMDTSDSPETTTVHVTTQHGASSEFQLTRVGRPDHTS